MVKKGVVMMKYYLFPKNFQQMTASTLMETVANCGFDGPTALVRNGYWLTKDNLPTALPLFVKEANQNGLEVKYGSADISMDSLQYQGEEWDLLKCFAENGITQVRLQHQSKNKNDDVRTYAERFRRQADFAAKAGEKIGIQCIVQLHGMCYPHSATAVYEGIKNVDPRYLGVKMDPGNNVCQEGYELYWYQIQLLGNYLAAMGVKDVGWYHNDKIGEETKGWYLEWKPAYEGIINYHEIFRYLKEAKFQGPIIQMPFYSVNTNEEWLTAVTKELAYFKQCEKEA